MTARSVAHARLLMITAYLAFIGLGLPDTINGVAWPGVRDTFGLPQSGLGLILAATATGYLVSSTLSGLVMRWLSIGHVLTLSTGLVIGALVGWATVPHWLAFLAFAVVLGAGGGAIDAALNYFVAIRFGARQLNWLHAFYGVGATLGPLVMTAVLALGWSWRGGVAVIAAALFPLALLYFFTAGIWVAGDSPSTPAKHEQTQAPAGFGGSLKRRAVWLQLAAFFVLTGVESTAGQWSFTLMTEGRGQGAPESAAWLAAFWAAFTSGRVLAGFAAEWLGTVRLMRGATLGLLLGVGAFFANLWPVTANLGLVLAGFCLGPLFPGLMAETPRRLGADVARHAVGFQVGAAILGAAAVPALAGVIAARTGIGVVAAVLLTTTVLFVVLHEFMIAALDR